MCIRALDYCPAVDITFGEYLRALITADIDLVPEDPLGYRVAFMEAFQKQGPASRRRAHGLRRDVGLEHAEEPSRHG